MNHFDIVQQVAAKSPVDTTTADSILLFILNVLKALPASEKAGLLLKPGGENIAPYKGQNVSISRVCYPDGQIYKILTDAGPGGSNGPAWNDDGTVDKARYLPVTSKAPAGGGTGTGTTTPSAKAQPYPGDQWVKETQAYFETVAGRPLDATWVGRTVYDIGAQNLTPKASRAKHEAELRQTLGLPPPSK